MNLTKKLMNSRSFKVFALGYLLAVYLYGYGPQLLKDLYVPNIILYLTIAATIVSLAKGRKEKKKTMRTVRTGAITHRRRISLGTALMIGIIIALLAIIAVPVFILPMLP